MFFDDSICSRCGGDNLTDYPVCPLCAAQVHCPHRVCVCADCRSEREQAEQFAERSLWLTERKWTGAQYTETAKRAGGVLVIRKAAA